MGLKHPGFSDEERRIRIRMVEMGIRHKDIARNLGIHIRDVSAVVRGVSRSPRYVAEVYKFLGLEMLDESKPQLIVKSASAQ